MFSPIFARLAILLLSYTPNLAFSEIKEESIEFSSDASSKNESISKIPTDLFFKDSTNKNFTISDDGTFLASVNQRSNKNFIVLYNIESKEIDSALNLGNFFPSAMFWKGEKLILNTEDQVVEIVKGNATTRSLLNSEDKVPTGKIYGYIKWKILSSLPDDPEHIYVSARDSHGSFLRVYQYNIFTGDLTERYDISDGPKNTLWHFDTDGKLIAGTNYNGGKFNIYHEKKGRLKPSSSIEMPNEYSISKTKMTSLSKRVFYEGPSNRSDTIYLSHNLNSDRYKIYEFNLEKNQFGNVIFGSKKYDIGGDWGFLWYASEKTLLGARYAAERYKDKWSDKRIIKLQTTINQKLPDATNTIVSYANNLSTALINSVKDNKGQHYIYNAKTEDLILYAINTPELHSYVLPKEKLVYYTSSDGSEHQAYLTLPNNMEHSSLPTIIMPSPNKWGRHLLSFSAWAKYFSSEGYAVLRMNHRGSYGYGRKYFTDGVKNQLELTTSDIHDATQWLIQKNISNKEKVYLFGNSEHSSTTSLLAVNRAPGLYSAVIAISPVVDMKKEYKLVKKNKNLSYIEYWDLAFSKKKDAKKELSYIKNITENTTPALLFYGEKSLNLSKKERKELAKKSKELDINLSVKTIKDENSRIRKNTNKVFIARSALDFIKSVENDQEKQK